MLTHYENNILEEQVNTNNLNSKMQKELSLFYNTVFAYFFLLLNFFNKKKR